MEIIGELILGATPAKMPKWIFWLHGTFRILLTCFETFIGILLILVSPTMGWWLLLIGLFVLFVGLFLGINNTIKSIKNYRKTYTK